MPDVSFFVDPSCPWAWVASRWITDVAPARDLDVTWKSYCIEIRDDYDLAPGFPVEHRALGLAAHELSHRMLRVLEAVRAEGGEPAVDAMYTAWGPRYFGADRGAVIAGNLSVIEDCLAACGLHPSLVDEQHNDKWDARIAESMKLAYRYAGEKTQTPAIVVGGTPRMDSRARSCLRRRREKRPSGSGMRSK